MVSDGEGATGVSASERTAAARAEELKASPAIFPYPALDRLTRAHPATPVVLFAFPIVLFAIASVRELGVLRTVAMVAIGYFFWTLCEYWGHRAVFHFEPEDGIGARLHWMIHGVHHDHPNDPRRLVLPPAFAIPLALLFFGLFWVTLRGEIVWGFAAGFYAGYVLYDSVHFALHHYTPRSRLGRHMRELHMRHHFEDHERGFGVSAPWWDIVFGTRPRRKSA
jgi:dihydroceramide fatty acyl 2-hydroxylase